MGPEGERNTVQKLDSTSPSSLRLTFTSNSLYLGCNHRAVEARLQKKIEACPERSRPKVPMVTKDVFLQPSCTSPKLRGDEATWIKKMQSACKKLRATATAKRKVPRLYIATVTEVMVASPRTAQKRSRTCTRPELERGMRGSCASPSFAQATSSHRRNRSSRTHACVCGEPQFLSSSATEPWQHSIHLAVARSQWIQRLLVNMESDHHEEVLDGVAVLARLGRPRAPHAASPRKSGRGTRTNSCGTTAEHGNRSRPSHTQDE